MVVPGIAVHPQAVLVQALHSRPARGRGSGVHVQVEIVAQSARQCACHPRMTEHPAQFRHQRQDVVERVAGKSVVRAQDVGFRPLPLSRGGSCAAATLDVTPVSSAGDCQRNRGPARA